MALPKRLWLPDGANDLPTWVIENRTGHEPIPTEHLRWRRKAVLASTGQQPERTVLVEWFPLSELVPGQLKPLLHLVHFNLLRLHQFGPADAKTAYVLSDAPLGVDVLSVVKAAKAGLPAFWAVAVILEAARGLAALHDQVRHKGLPRGHGTLDPSTIFVSPTGRVQLLCFAPPLKTDDAGNTIAPEVRRHPRLNTPAADVFSLSAILRDLPLQEPLPAACLSFLSRGMSLRLERRPTLPCFAEQLAAWLPRLGAPLKSAIGSELARILPTSPRKDLAEIEWSNTGPAQFGPLPKTLSPLSSTAVSLSATWDTVPPQQPKRHFSVLWALLFTSLCVGLGAVVCATWDTLPASPKPARATHFLRLPSAPSSSVAWPLRPGEHAEIQGVRVSILSAESTDRGFKLRLLLVNPTGGVQPFDPSRLHIQGLGGQQVTPTEPPPPIDLPPGRMKTMEVLLATAQGFVPNRLLP